MKKTPFAGLSMLDPGEPLSDDNGAFTGRDRKATDHFLEIGAKTHRHNEEAGLANPAIAPSASIIASGGAIPSNLSISLAYTFEDAVGGETMASPVAVVSTPGPVGAPQAPPVAAVSTAGGELLVNTYYYALTFTDGEGGETPLGPAATAQRAPGFPVSQVELSGLAGGLVTAGAAGWRLYRAVGGNAYNLLATGDETEDTFIDDGTHSLDCSTHPPAGEANTTAGISTLLVTVPPTIPDESPFVNLYASITGDFGGGSLLGRFPAASAGKVVSFPSLTLGELSPPPVNRSIGGAHKIDPDTELIDWHWKRPVGTKAELPTKAEGSADGDVRIVTDEDSAYIFDEGEEKWIPWVGGGGGALTVFASGGHPGSSGPLTLTDSFPGSALNAHWFAVEEEGGPAIDLDDNWVVAGGRITKAEAGGGQGLRDDVFGLNGQIITEFGDEEEGSFACIVHHMLRAAATGPKEGKGKSAIFAGYNGSLGKGSESGGIEIFLRENGETFALAAGKELAMPLGTYWLVSEVNGSVVKCAIYDEDPAIGGPTPLDGIEADLTDEIEFSSPTAQARYLTAGYFGMEFVGAEGGHVNDWRFSGTAGAGPLNWVDGAEFIEFEMGSALAVTASATGVRVTLPSGGSEEAGDLVALLAATGKGFVYAGEDLTTARPAGYASIEWMTKGEPGKPENMGEHDTLVEIP